MPNNIPTTKNLKQSKTVASGQLSFFDGFDTVRAGIPDRPQSPTPNHVLAAWQKKSSLTLNGLLAKSQNNLALHISTKTATATSAPLKQKNLITLYAKDKECFDYLYCLLNSSFALTYLQINNDYLSIPVFCDLLSDEDEDFFNKTSKKMIFEEPQYTITKYGAESIVFPKEYRDKLNKRFLKILGINESELLLNFF